MKRKFAGDLEEGDVVRLPMSLVVQAAVVKSLRSIPSKQGSVMIADLETAGEGPWSGAKATFAFLGNEKIDFSPPTRPSIFRDWVLAVVRFLNFTK